jgi:HK97 gp10 family phage protein
MTGVRMEGFREFQRALRKLGAQAADFKEIMFPIGEKVVNDAKSLTPVRTGSLRDSIRASKAQNSVSIRAGKAKVPYASFVEWGTGSMSAQENITGAVEANEEYAKNKLDEGLQELINRLGLN